MHHFQNLLYVSHGTTDETEGLKQALSIARNNSASLKVLVISPKITKELADYKIKFEQSLLDQIQDSINSTKSVLKIQNDELDVSVELISDKAPATKIIQCAMQNKHDLVIKEAESQEGKDGFKSIDMALLRKCPCPVWLSRPIKESRDKIQVAVAIDPKDNEPPALALSKEMLVLSGSIADHCSGELQIISCWDYPNEGLIRGNVFLGISDEKLDQSIQSEEQAHRAALESLIKSTTLSGKYQMNHIRGTADKEIPAFVKNHKIDILIMGTVARTGLEGFFIGNTAENIIQKLNCSVLALKPHGFISPVKAY